jgi:hypothetical protein
MPVILFFGTMNAMPMMYARAYRAAGRDVVYFVDVPPSDTLSRPENHFADITYPYAHWIVEQHLPTQLIASLFPRLVKKTFTSKANIPRGSVPEAVFLGGYFVALAPYFPSQTKKIFLSYGSDLERWVDSARSDEVYDAVRSTSVFRLLPEKMGRWLIKKVMQRNEAGANACDDVLFFPKGMSPQGDKVIDKLVEHGVRYTPRYDISFDIFEGVDRVIKDRTSEFVVVSPVRFLYSDLPAEFAHHNKGNDLIIRGLARFRSETQAQLKVHFFDKGPDAEHARALCVELGIADVVTWHNPVPLTQLLSMYESADVVFDQVGSHWVGAVGMYALYMGKPLIANLGNLGFLGEIPALQAADVDGIVQALHVAHSRVGLADLHVRAKEFAQASVGPEAVIKKLGI